MPLQTAVPVGSNGDGMFALEQFSAVNLVESPAEAMLRMKFSGQVAHIKQPDGYTSLRDRLQRFAKKFSLRHETAARHIAVNPHLCLLYASIYFPLSNGKHYSDKVIELSRLFWQHLGITPLETNLATFFSRSETICREAGIWIDYDASLKLSHNLPATYPPGGVYNHQFEHDWHLHAP